MKQTKFKAAHQILAAPHLLVLWVLFTPLTAEAGNYTFHTINDRAAIDQARANIVSIGESCPAVESLWNIRENGQSTTIFKVACSNNRDYQLTITGGKLYVKRWTGNLLGN